MAAHRASQEKNFQFTIHKLVNPTDLDVEVVTNTLAQCFHEDKFVHIITAHDPKLYVPFFKSQVVAAIIDGVIYVAKDRSGAIIGAAVWFGPGQEMFVSPRQIKEAWQPFEDLFFPELKAWWDDVLTPVDDAFVLKSFGPGTKRRGWHLQVIGILPEYQRRGIATTIINEVRRIATDKHLPMTLEVETETLVKVYSSLGFHLKHKVENSLEEKHNLWYVCMYLASNEAVENKDGLFRTDKVPFTMNVFAMDALVDVVSSLLSRNGAPLVIEWQGGIQYLRMETVVRDRIIQGIEQQ